MTRTPWMKFYFTDWRSEPTLRLVSREARSLWLDILGLIHESGSGRLEVAGRPATDRDLSAMLGDNPRTIRKLLGELEAARVFSRDEGGFVISRRIIRDLKKAELDRNNGRMGGNPALKNKDLAEKGVNPQKPEARSQIPEEERKRPNGLLSETSSDKRPKRAPKGKGRIEYPEAFERLWAAYPSRPNQSKAKALEAWLKFDKERREGAVIAAPLFAEQCRKAGTDPQFIPHCSTWLNERRFDEFVEYEDDGEAEGQRDDGGIRAAADRPADEENLHPDGGGMGQSQGRLVSGAGQHGPGGQADHAPMAGLLDAHRLQAERLAREAAQGCDPWRHGPDDLDGAGALPQRPDGGRGRRHPHAHRFH